MICSKGLNAGFGPDRKFPALTQSSWGRRDSTEGSWGGAESSLELPGEVAPARKAYTAGHLVDRKLGAFLEHLSGPAEPDIVKELHGGNPEGLLKPFGERRPAHH